MSSAAAVRRAIRRFGGIAGAVLVTSALAFAAAGVAAGGSGTPAGDRFTATPIQPDSAPIESAKSATGQLAESDPSLLGRTDDTPVNVMVKLDYDSVATYEGNEPGLPATSPAVTGEELQDNQAAVAAYESHVAGIEAEIQQDIQAEVPQAQVRESFRVAYGGLAMRVPGEPDRRPPRSRRRRRGAEGQPGPAADRRHPEPSSAPPACTHSLAERAPPARA